MSKKAFDKIAEGLNEALAITRGEMKAARVHVPAEIDTAAIRKRLKLSRREFADVFGFTVNQIEDWEEGRTMPVGGARTYIMLIGARPQDVQTLLSEVGDRAVS